MTLYDKYLQLLELLSEKLLPSDTKTLEALTKLASGDLSQTSHLIPSRLKRLDKIKDDEVKALEEYFVGGKWETRVQNFVKARIKKLNNKRFDLRGIDVPTTKKKREDANKLAYELLQEKGTDFTNYTNEEKAVLSKFTGFGGLGKSKNEYYTPIELASATWQLAGNLSDGSKVLDPSCGAGIFANTAPSDISLDATELNPTSGGIAIAINPNQQTKIKPFEKLDTPDNSYDAVVTNVPFGIRSEEYRDLDLRYGDIKTNEDFFILKSLDLLKSGGRGVFLTTSSTAQRKTQTREASRLAMLKKGCFLGGYRLPSKMFKDTGTDVVVDVLVFEKHKEPFGEIIERGLYQPDDLANAISISKSSQEFLKGEYFDKNVEKILGEQFMALEDYSPDEHHHVAKDSVATELSLKEIKALLSGQFSDKGWKNTFGYGEITVSQSAKEVLLQNKLIESLTEKIVDLDVSLADDAFTMTDDTFNDLIKEATEKGVLPSIRFRHIGMYQIEKLIGEPLQEAPLAKVRGAFRSFLSIGEYNKWLLTLDSGVDIKSIEEENPLYQAVSLQNYKGKPIYSIDGLSDDAFENKNVGMIIVKGEPWAIAMSDCMALYNNMNYMEAINKITESEFYPDKQDQIVEQLRSFKHTKTLDGIEYSLAMARNYLTGQKTRSPLLREIKNIGKNELEKLYLDKLAEAYNKYSENVGNIEFETVLYSSGGVLFDIIESKLQGTNLKVDYSRLVKNVTDRGIVRGLLIDAYNALRGLINFYIKEAFSSNDMLKGQLLKALDDNSTIASKNEDMVSFGDPMEELRGMVKDDAIQSSRLYQNEDARRFSLSLGGTIHQRMGLGKSRTMLLASLNALRANNAKRVLVLTPNAVTSKLEAEFRSLLTDEWQDRMMVLNSSTFDTDLRKMKSEDMRIIVAPHSIVRFFKLQDKTIKHLAFNLSESGEMPSPTSFRSLIGQLPTFSDGRAYFENTGIDAIFIDEVQDFKNGVASFGMARASPKTASGHVDLMYIAQYIRRIKRKDNQGVVGVTGTAHTNSPTEILSNLVLTGGHLDGNGNPLKGFDGATDFVSQFIIEDDIIKPKVNGRGVTVAKTFVGFQNFDTLKDIVQSSVLYRTAEEEQKRVEGLNVEPPHDIVDVEGDDLDPEISETFDILANLNDSYSLSRNDREKFHNLPKDKIRRSLGLSLNATMGETFGFINRARNLSNGADFAKGVTKIKLTSNETNIEEIKKALGKTKHFTFLTWKDKESLSLEDLEKLPILLEARESGEDVAHLAPEFLEHGYFNAYSIDDKEVDSIIKKLIRAKLVDPNDIFDLERYPKYRNLVRNIKERYEPPFDHSKQIIFSDRPIVTQRIIGQIVGAKVRGGELPLLKIHHFSKMGGLKADKSNAMDIQDNFNDSDTPDIMIYGIAGITGVDFNRNVSAVHLMNIAEKPDTHQQAQARAVRQGNTSHVKVFKYFTVGTFDKFLDEMSVTKGDWIEALKQNGDVNTELETDSSSSAQILQQALLKYKGEKNMSVDDKIKAFMRSKIEDERKEQEEIEAVKIKRLIMTLSAKILSAKLIQEMGIDEALRVEMDKVTDRVSSHISILYPMNSFGSPYMNYSRPNPRSIDEWITSIRGEWKEDGLNILTDNVKDINALREEITVITENIGKQRKQLKVKSTSEINKNLDFLMREKESKQTLMRLATTKLFKVMYLDGKNYNRNKTTFEDLRASLYSSIDKEMTEASRVLSQGASDIDGVNNAIERLRTDILNRATNENFNSESVVKFGGALYSIEEVIQLLRENEY